MTDTLQRTYDWFIAAHPKPDIMQWNSQLGVHFEEVGEMLDELNSFTAQTNTLINNAKDAMVALADFLKSAGREQVVAVLPGKQEQFLDSLCDQIVTATGVAQVCRYDLVGAMKAVNTSNFSKFDNNGKPIFAPGGKITKGPNYIKANLKSYTYI